MLLFNKMSFRLILSLVFVCSFISVVAQKKNNSLLYKVEKKGAEPFYLYGTIHMICADQFKVSSSLESVIDKVETLYLELDMNDINPFAIFPKAVAKESIEDYVEPATLDSLKKFVANQKGMQLPWMVVKNLQPLFVQQLFLQNILDCKTESYDLYLNKQFKDAGKIIKGLETFEFQIDMISNIEYKDQMNDLLNFMRNPDQSKIEFQKLVDLYLKGSAHDLFAMMEQDETISSVQDKFLFERNENWVKIMKANTGKHKYLYAFGAGHLGGKRGVLELLKKEGYKITPVI